MISEACGCWGCAPTPDITPSLKKGLQQLLGAGGGRLQAPHHINLGNWSPPTSSSPVSTPARVCPRQQPPGGSSSESQDMHKQCTLRAAEPGHKEKVKWRVLYSRSRISKSHMMSQREAAQPRTWEASASTRHTHQSCSITQHLHTGLLGHIQIAKFLTTFVCLKMRT